MKVIRQLRCEHLRILVEYNSINYRATDDDCKAHNGKITFARTSMYTAGCSASYGQTFLECKQRVQNALKLFKFIKREGNALFLSVLVLF